MCNCDDTSNITIPNGSDGEDGLFGGYSLPWTFSTSTSVSPATGGIRMNSATYASVTNIYINVTDQNAVAASNFLADFSNGGVFGKIKLFKEYDSSVFWTGTITSVTSAGSYYNIGVTYVLHNGTFANGNDIVVSFTPKGATGSAGSNGNDGADGVDGASVLSYTTSVQSTTSITWSTYATHTVSANQLSANGDKLKLLFHTYRTGGIYDTPSAFRILINGTWFTVDFARGEISGARPYGIMEMEITRTSSSTASVECKTISKDATFIMHPQYHTYNSPTVASAVVTFDWTASTAIAFQVINDENTSTTGGMYASTTYYKKS